MGRDRAVGLRLARTLGLLAGLVLAGAASGSDAGSVLVVDQFSRSLVRVDLATGNQTVLVREGSVLGPRGLEWMPDGTILVANEDARSIVRIDPATGDRSFVWAPTELGPPRSLVAADAGTLFVATARIVASGVVAAPAVVRVDLVTGATALITQGLPLRDPADLALGPDGRLYLADPTARVIFRIDPDTGEQVVISPPAGLPDEENLLGTPQGLDFDAAGQLVVAANDRVLRVDPVTGAQELVTFSSLLPSPRALRVAADGTYFVVDRLNSRLVRIFPATGTQALIGERLSGLINGPIGVAIGDDGRIFVSNFTANSLVRFNLSNNNVTRIAEGGSLSLPYAAVIDAEGYAIVADSDPQSLEGQSGVVVRADLETGAQRVLSRGNLLRLPQGIALRSDGMILMPDLINRAVIAVNPETGGQSSLLVFPPGSGPAGIAIASDGALWIGDRFRNAIIRAVPGEGQALVSQGGLLDEPNALAFESDGKLLVSDKRRVIRIDPSLPGPTDNQSLAFEGLQEQRLFGLLVRADGQILTSDAQGAAVLALESESVAEPITSEGALEFPTGLTPVPEPGALAASLAALGALAAQGLARRREQEPGAESDQRSI